MRFAGVVLALPLALIATSARADDATGPEGHPVPAAPTSTSATPAPPAPSRATHWYGWQTLLVDAGAIGLATVSANSTGAGYGALGLYAFGGPLVHVLHDRAGIGGLDLGIRVGGPIVLGLIGMGIELATTKESSCSDFCFRGLAGF